MAEPDELYTLRNHFWTGNYQRAISEGANLTRLNDALKVECSEYVYRSYIALGQTNVVLDEVKDSPSTPPSLRAVVLLARYMNARGSSEKDGVVAAMDALLNDPNAANSSTLQLLAATVFMSEGNFKDALRCIHLGTTMEHLALTVQIFLQMNRVDLVAKQLRLMSQADEDHTLTQLASAWSFMYQGDKLQEAAYVFDELIEKFGSTPLLLNGVAVANMHMNKFDEAEKSLLEALSKNQNDPDTLINLISCYQHLGKPTEVISRYSNQLKSVAPHHPFVEHLKTVEGAFDRVAQGFA